MCHCSQGAKGIQGRPGTLGPIGIGEPGQPVSITVDASFGYLNSDRYGNVIHDPILLPLIHVSRLDNGNLKIKINVAIYWTENLKTVWGSKMMRLFVYFRDPQDLLEHRVTRELLGRGSLAQRWANIWVSEHYPVSCIPLGITVHILKSEWSLV